MARPLTAKFPIVVAGLLLGVFSVAGAGLVAVTHVATRDRIAQNERQALLDRLAVLVPTERITNDMATDQILVSDPDRLGSERTTVYRARAGDSPVAVILSPVVPDGSACPGRVGRGPVVLREGAGVLPAGRRGLSGGVRP